MVWRIAGLIPNGRPNEHRSERSAAQRRDLPKLDAYFVLWVQPVPAQDSACVGKHECTGRRRLKPDSQL